MAEYKDIMAESEVTDGRMKSVDVDGKQVLIARVNGTVYAVSNNCPHVGGKLSEGRLEGSVVTCPKHGSQFDVKTGKIVRWLQKEGLLESLSKAVKQPQPLAAYQVKVEGGRVFVAV